MTAARHPGTEPAPKPGPDPREVAVLLRRLVAAVEDGTLDVSSPRARRLVRQLEQVADAFDEIADADRNPGEDTGDARP